MGHARFLVFCLLCGVAAAALQIFSQPDSGIPMFGALGAIGGVAFWAQVGGFAAGAALVLLFRSPEIVAQHPMHGWRRMPEEISECW